MNVETANDSVQAKVKKPGEEEPDVDHGVKEENTWESITDGIDGNAEFIDSSSQSKQAGESPHSASHPNARFSFGRVFEPVRSAEGDLRANDQSYERLPALPVGGEGVAWTPEPANRAHPT